MIDLSRFEITLEQPFNQALEEVETTLIQLGFTIMTRVDVQRMMKDQMEIEFLPYIILGACDTPIATRALEIDPSIGLMLPCNVSVESTQEGHTKVRVVDPIDSLGCRASKNSNLAQLAAEASQRMSEIITSLRATARPTSPEAKPWDRLAHVLPE